MPLTAIARRLALRRVPARPLAMARMMIGAAALIFAFDTATIVRGLLADGALRLPYALPPALLVAESAALLLTLWVLSAVALTVGWRTRTTAFVLAVSAGISLALDAQLYSNHLYLLALMAGILVFADSGASLSLDARREAARATVPWLSVLALQSLASIVYGFGALAKVNPQFLSGFTLANYVPRSALDLLPPRTFTAVFLVALSFSVVVLELVLAFALWRPRLRNGAFALGALLHAGMIAGVPVGKAHVLLAFAMLMFATYLCFLDAAPASRVVVWDDTCSACAVWVGWFRRLDWLGVHTFEGSSDPQVLARHGLSREEADTAMQWYGPDAEHRAGFLAVVGVLESLPLTFLIAPLLRLPGVRHAGEVCYRRYAARRSCLLPEATAAI